MTRQIMKQVLLVTRPLVPPWDEASKNFAYFLGRTITGQSLTLMTTKTSLLELPATVHQKVIFSGGHFDFMAKIALLRYLRASRNLFDITHYLFTPTQYNSALLRWFAKPTKGKTLQTIATLRDDLYSPKALRAMLFADHLVTYTATAKQKLERLGFTNVTHIYPGIDLLRYAPKPKDTILLKQFGFTADHYIVIYPGEYMRLGATDMLTEAFIDFFTKHPETDIRFLFACRVKNEADAQKKKAVYQRFADARLLAYVAFSDTVVDMSALYNSADLIVFPVENLRGKFDVPLIIIEAYACGKPVILSDLEQFREFANDTICVTIPKNSGTQLIQKMVYLRDNIQEGVRLGVNARRFAESSFDLKDTAKQYEAIYTSL